MHGHSGPLQGSTPRYSHPPLRWQTGLRNEYTFKDSTKDVYVFRNNVPMDSNWGRSDVGIWAVDATKQWQGDIIPDDYTVPFCPYIDKPFIARFNPEAAMPRAAQSGQVYPVALGSQPDVGRLRSLHTSTSAWRLQ